MPHLEHVLALNQRDVGPRLCPFRRWYPQQNISKCIADGFNDSCCLRFCARLEVERTPRDGIAKLLLLRSDRRMPRRPFQSFAQPQQAESNQRVIKDEAEPGKTDQPRPLLCLWLIGTAWKRRI